MDSTGVNKTEKPKARMRVFSHSVDVSKGVVTLNDPLGMEIKLEEDYQDSFDIRAKDCTAAVIPIIRHECAPDLELFPNFEKKNRGALESNFRAFQPTNLNGEAEADVIFTCQLSVCRGDCQRTHCSGNANKIRRAADEVNEITVGTRIRVISPLQNQTLEERFFPNLCMERLFVYLIAILVGIVMLGSWAAIGFLVTRLVSSGIKPDLEVARSVGRRLSSILNLPQGYNFKDPKRFGCIPEEEGMTPPQQRRKSVTVMHVGAIDA
ncbi:uncharacterized protein LOC125661894 isoform X2 [Ostrea edulis]|nr:uncharacterized protein LOC125661894 isoform X2 [Ostrea edulis]XP_056002453.1 uncharacterized protein LOC125661894 isoform X2 [Ostrea edulis]